MSVHLFTGFPGFISSQLIRELFRKNYADHIYALVLPTQKEKALDESLKIMESFPGRRITIVEGDINLPQIGIAEKTLSEFANNIKVVWHLAAIYDLAVPKEVAWKVNVDGTKNVNDFVQTLPNLTRYIYFSTAYVAGKREGIILENDLMRPEGFKNYYEETKFEAELLVEDIKKMVPTTIIRPGIVRGNSLTGETQKFDGPYFFLNMIDKLKFLPAIPYVGRSTALINVVPIDFIIEASAFISQEDEAIGKTLHLTDPHPHPVLEVYRMMVKLMTSKFPKGRLPLSLTRQCLKIKAIRKLLGVEFETLDYLTWNAYFDCSEAKKILAKGKIKCPDFIKSMPSMVNYYNNNKHKKEYHIEIK
ncbi:SDR family oxidoreductase [Ureibacillus acetophenoni]